MLTPLPSSSTLPASVSAPNASAHPAPEVRAGEGRRGFAQALEQAAAADAAADTASESAAPAQAEPVEPPSPGASAGATGAANTAKGRATWATRLDRAAVAAAAQAASGSKAVEPGLGGANTGLTSAASLSSEDTQHSDEAAPDASAVGALLSQLQAAAHQTTAQPTAQTALQAVQTRSTSAEGEAGSASGKGARRSGTLVSGDIARGAIGATRPGPTSATDLTAPTPTTAQALQLTHSEDLSRVAALAGERPPEMTTALTQTTPAAPSAPGFQTLPAMTSGAGTPPSTGEARLSASPGSPDFGPQLGAQITTFVRDGLENARLQLHPADMGPVLVQIQLDGQTAQVHLSAEHPLTRQALEDALPQLASQLREAGLTLSGGGVSEQAQQGRQAPSDQPSGRTASAEPARPAPLEARQPVARRGVVDLVA